VLQDLHVFEQDLTPSRPRSAPLRSRCAPSQRCRRSRSCFGVFDERPSATARRPMCCSAQPSFSPLTYA